MFCIYARGKKLKVDLSTPPPTPPHSWGGESSEDLDDLRGFPPSNRKAFIEEGGPVGMVNF
jgi:hypothetical protein